MLVDSQGNPLTSLDSFEIIKSTPAAFTGGVDNTRGDVDNTPTNKIFTVIGDVELGIFGVGIVDLVGGATLEVGVAGNTAGLIAQTTATDIDANDIWLDATPSVGLDVVDALSFYFVVNGMDIIETVASADITAGQIYYVCLWRPLTFGSKVGSASVLSA